MRWHCPIRLACFGWRTSKTILCQGSSANHSGCKPATPPLQRRGRFPCGRLSGLRALAAAGSRRVSLSPVRSSTSLDTRHSTLWAVSEFTAVLRILKLLRARANQTTRAPARPGQSTDAHPSLCTRAACRCSARSKTAPPKQPAGLIMPRDLATLAR